MNDLVLRGDINSGSVTGSSTTWMETQARSKDNEAECKKNSRVERLMGKDVLAPKSPRALCVKFE